MQKNIQLPFFTLLLLIAFASVNAVLFTPALPAIADYFAITSEVAQYTITTFLIGYAFGQLIYGPVANRYGRKRALYMGISIQILSSLLCVYAGVIHSYSLMVFARFVLALGSGVGLKMTFTLVNECYEPKVASQKIAYLMPAFAITPGIAVALGGILSAHYGWESCFYAGAVYGLLLLFLASRLPETLVTVDYDAFKWGHLFGKYISVFKNAGLIAGALLMGSTTSFIYVFAAVAPFVAMELLGMSVQQYGLANVLPPIGMILGSLSSAQLIERYPLNVVIRLGIAIASVGVLLLVAAVCLHLAAVLSVFAPMVVINFGLAIVNVNASTVAMSHVSDKVHAAAVMSFVNMGFTTLMVFGVGCFAISVSLLPMIYVGLCVFMLGVYRWLSARGSLVLA